MTALNLSEKSSPLGALGTAQSIGAALRHSALIYSSLPFLWCDQEKLSFLDFDRKVDRAASGLLRIGIAKGDRVALWLGNSPAWALWFFACARIGAVTVPVSTRFKAEEMAFVVAHAGCKVLIVSAPKWGIDFYRLLLQVAPEVAEQRPSHLQSVRLPDLRHVLLEADETLPGTLSLTSIAAETIAIEELSTAEKHVEAHDLLLLSYTSGTTGAPKGVMHCHKVLTQATRVGHALRMEVGDCVLGHMPFYHVAGLFMGLMPAMVLGAKLVILEDWQPANALRLMAEQNVTIFGGIPTHFQDLMSAPSLRDYDLTALKSAWIGGSSAPQELYERIDKMLRIPKVLSTYGMTENTISTTFSRWDDPPEVVHQNRAPILGNCEVVIVDPVSGARLPAGHDGEIWCRGETVMLGYYRNPDATRDAITSEGWLRTGDIGRLDKDGYLSITGRYKEMFKIGGTNAYPAEIEQHIAKLTGVLMSAVVGVPDDRLGEVGFAFVQKEPQSAITTQDIIEHCRRWIADYKVPRYVQFVDEFPRTPSGKIKKFELSFAARQHVESKVLPN